MQDVFTYHIEIKGPVDENDFNNGSPLLVKASQENTAFTQFTFRADQAGLVGLIRHLHQQGFVLLSLARKENLVYREEND